MLGGEPGVKFGLDDVSAVAVAGLKDISVDDAFEISGNWCLLGWEGDDGVSIGSS